MTNVHWERWARATGIVFVALFVVSFIVYGDSPGVNDSAQKIAAFYDGDRGRVLTATFIFGSALVFLLWFAAAIASAVREAGKGGWGAATIGSGAAMVSVFFVMLTVGAGLAFNVAGGGDESLTKALNTLVWMCEVVVSFPAAALIAAASIGLWRSRLVPDWFGWAGVVAAMAVLLGGTTWASDGFWAPDGAYSQWITPVVALAWIAVASGLLYSQAPGTVPTPERAAATPAP